MSTSQTQTVERTQQGADDPRRLGAAIAQRLVGTLVLLWGTVSLAFFAVKLAPGDPVDLLIGEAERTPEVEAAIVERWGLDRPVIVQYTEYLWNALRGDFGTSFVQRRPVTEVITAELWPTVELTIYAVVFTAVITAALAILTAGRRRASAAASLFEMTLESLPGFWIGLMLIVVFSFQLGWFPVAGNATWTSNVLPAFALALGAVGVLSQVLRQGIENALLQPFTTTVVGRGASRFRVKVGHAARHALLPTLNLVGFQVGGLLGGAVIIEQVFGRPGIGRVTLEAISNRDLPVILGVALFGAFVYVAVNTVVDLVSLLIDPRLQVESRAFR